MGLPFKVKSYFLRRKQHTRTRPIRFKHWPKFWWNLRKMSKENIKSARSSKFDWSSSRNNRRKSNQQLNIHSRRSRRVWKVVFPIPRLIPTVFRSVLGLDHVLQPRKRDQRLFRLLQVGQQTPNSIVVI